MKETVWTRIMEFINETAKSHGFMLWDAVSINGWKSDEQHLKLRSANETKNENVNVHKNDTARKWIILVGYTYLYKRLRCQKRLMVRSWRGNTARKQQNILEQPYININNSIVEYIKTTTVHIFFVVIIVMAGASLNDWV